MYNGELSCPVVTSSENDDAQWLRWQAGERLEEEGFCFNFVKKGFGKSGCTVLIGLIIDWCFKMEQFVHEYV